jgi:hypothetical protein
MSVTQKFECVVPTCSFPTVSSTSCHEQENFRKSQLSLVEVNGKCEILGPNNSTSFPADEVGIASNVLLRLQAGKKIMMTLAKITNHHVTRLYAMSSK